MALVNTANWKAARDDFGNQVFSHLIIDARADKNDSIPHKIPHHVHDILCVRSPVSSIYKYLISPVQSHLLDICSTSGWSPVLIHGATIGSRLFARDGCNLRYDFAREVILSCSCDEMMQGRGECNSWEVCSQTESSGAVPLMSCRLLRFSYTAVCELLIVKRRIRGNWAAC